jgi:uncharacterized protein (TIGR04141 family)
LVFDKLPKEFQTFISDSTPKSEEFHVVFGIITDKTELRLPFFSRVGIRHAVSRLTGFRYKVSLARIGVAETRSKLKKVKTKRIK